MTIHDFDLWRVSSTIFLKVSQNPWCNSHRLYIDNDDHHHNWLCHDIAIGSTLDFPFIVHNSASLASAGQLIR